MTALELIALTESERMYLAALRYHERQALIDDRKHRPISSRHHVRAVQWIQRAQRPLISRVVLEAEHRDREGQA